MSTWLAKWDSQHPVQSRHPWKIDRPPRLERNSPRVDPCELEIFNKADVIGDELV